MVRELLRTACEGADPDPASTNPVENEAASVRRQHSSRHPPVLLVLADVQTLLRLDTRMSARRVRGVTLDGTRLKKLRGRRRQGQLATEAGIDQKTISRAESSLRIDESSAVKIAAAHGFQNWRDLEKSRLKETTPHVSLPSVFSLRSNLPRLTELLTTLWRTPALLWGLRTAVNVLKTRSVIPHALVDKRTLTQLQALGLIRLSSTSLSDHGLLARSTRLARLLCWLVDLAERRTATSAQALIETGWSADQMIRTSGVDADEIEFLFVLQEVVQRSVTTSEMLFARDNPGHEYARVLNSEALKSSVDRAVSDVRCLHSDAFRAAGRISTLLTPRLVCSGSMLALIAMTYLAEEALAKGCTDFRFVRRYNAMSSDTLSEIKGGSSDTWDICAIADWEAKKLLCRRPTSGTFIVLMNLPSQLHSVMAPSRGWERSGRLVVPHDTTAEGGFARIAASLIGRRKARVPVPTADVGGQALRTATPMVIWEPYGYLVESEDLFSRLGAVLPHSAYLVAPYSKYRRNAADYHLLAAALADAWLRLRDGIDSVATQLLQDAQLRHSVAELAKFVGGPLRGPQDS